MHATSRTSPRRATSASPARAAPRSRGYAATHAILGASERCVATHPSDLAVALAALDAVVVVLGAAGERRVPIAELTGCPATSRDRDTTLAHGDLITAVELPGPAAGASRSTYRKVRDRASYAFALVSVAAALDVEDGVVRDVRIALGGVAHKPWRATRAEEALRGPGATEDRVPGRRRRRARRRPSRCADNAFKVPMARNTIVATLRALAEEAAR